MRVNCCIKDPIKHIWWSLFANNFWLSVVNYFCKTLHLKPLPIFKKKLYLKPLPIFEKSSIYSHYLFSQKSSIIDVWHDPYGYELIALNSLLTWTLTRRHWNPFKYLRWSVLRKELTAFSRYLCWRNTPS